MNKELALSYKTLLSKERNIIFRQMLQDSWI